MTRWTIGLIFFATLAYADPVTPPPSGLSTTFVGVVMSTVPVGEKVQVEHPDGRGLEVTNTGTSPLRVRARIRVPIPERLRPGAIAIPDREWLQVWPRETVIEPGETFVFDLKLTVPNDRQYVGKTYQAMIWIRGVSMEAQGLPVGGGLMTRLRFTTVPARSHPQ